MDARCEDHGGNEEPSSVPTAPEVSPPIDSANQPPDGRIALNAIEKKLFETLLDTCKRAGLKTQLRVAGGWVRDKLLGKDSIDIDIALDDMMGKEFAEKVKEHLISMGVETTSIGVVQSNPNQSKHLETATTRVHGVAIDFVNLRSEKYAEDSRIPTVEFGTAEQDALRRDLTINSLFYNINTGGVEDFTGRGLDDLRRGIIRTPLNPVETFLDDPLRVLRAIRFGARFGFGLDDELAEAAASEAVREALATKISRERIGVEVELMLKGQDPLMAMRNISRLGLFSIVFALPEHAKLAIKFDYGSVCVACLEEVLDVLKQWPRDSFTANDRWICLLGGLLMPLRETTIPWKKKSTPVSAVLIREALKLRGKDSDMVAALHISLPSIRALIGLLVDADDGMVKTDGNGSADAVAPNSGDNISISSGFSSLEARQRIAAGLAVRTLKELWRPALVLSAAAASAPVASTPLGQEPTDGDSTDVKLDVDGDTKIRERRDNSVKRARAAAIHAEAEAIICGLGLDRAWEIKPILDGSSVMSVLGMKSGGPLLGHAMGRVIEWQLANPNGTVDELKQWLQHNASSLTRADSRTRK